jgi:hypothetical protein
MNKELEVFVIMPESVFKEFDSKTRSLFRFTDMRETNEYEDNKGDEIYKQLYKTKRDAEKQLQSYLFKKRHG